MTCADGAGSPGSTAACLLRAMQPRRDRSRGQRHAHDRAKFTLEEVITVRNISVKRLTRRESLQYGMTTCHSLELELHLWQFGRASTKGGLRSSKMTDDHFCVNSEGNCNVPCSRAILMISSPARYAPMGASKCYSRCPLFLFAQCDSLYWPRLPMT
jgi:hypothetical protein